MTKSTGAGKGWATTVVRTRARLTELAAFLWNFESRGYADLTGDTKRVVLEDDGGFSKVVMRKQKVEGKYFGGGESAATTLVFVNKMSLNVISGNKIVITAEPEDGRGDSSDADNSGSGVVHSAREKIAIKLTRRGEHDTKVEFVVDLDLGAAASGKLVQNRLEKYLHDAATIKMFFAYQVQAADMTEKDGEVLALAMHWNKIEEMHAEESKVKSIAISAVRSTGLLHDHDREDEQVREVIMKSKALMAVNSKYSWITILIQRARRGAVAVNHPVSTCLASLEEREARIVGNNLMPALKKNKTAAAGVDQWRMQNKAIDELLAEFPWMKGFFIAIGQSVVYSATWGLKWR